MQGLRQELDLAASAPEYANLKKLFDSLETALLSCPNYKRLELIADFILEVTQIHLKKVDLVLAAWEDKNNSFTEEPSLDLDFLNSLIRQTLDLNLKDIVEEKPTYSRAKKPNTLVGTVLKENLLQVLDYITTDKENLFDGIPAELELTSQWQEKINNFLLTQKSPIGLLDLQRKVKAPLVDLWLALLLGDFELEQKGEFYQTETIYIFN